MLPYNSIDIEVTNLIPNFYNNLLNRATLKSTTTRKCYTFKTVLSYSYLTSTSIPNYTTYDNFGNTSYEVYVPLIDNEWEYYEVKDGEESLNS